MLGLKLIYVSKRGPWWREVNCRWGEEPQADMPVDFPSQSSGHQKGNKFSIKDEIK